MIRQIGRSSKFPVCCDVLDHREYYLFDQIRGLVLFVLWYSGVKSGISTLFSAGIYRFFFLSGFIFTSLRILFKTCDLTKESQMTGSFSKGTFDQ
jgi:hypothetical protein